MDFFRLHARVKGSYEIVLCAIMKQVKHFHETGYRDGRIATELYFEQALQVRLLLVLTCVCACGSADHSLLWRFAVPTRRVCRRRRVHDVARRHGQLLRHACDPRRSEAPASAIKCVLMRSSVFGRTLDRHGRSRSRLRVNVQHGTQTSRQRLKPSKQRAKRTFRASGRTAASCVWCVLLSLSLSCIT